MKEIIQWLIQLEKIAGELYDGASRQFTNDKKLSLFLRDLAEDEGWHYHIMGSAAEYLRKTSGIKSDLTLDSTTKEKIEYPFRRNQEMLSAGTLTKESIINGIVDTEYSEWNHIFIYIVNTLNQQGREFMYVASKMQNHIEEITEFLKSLPRPNVYLDKICSLPEIWQRKLLIIENYEPIKILLKSLLEDFGTIETVSNGKDALAKVNNSHYDVILSDIDMPSMNGIDFCKEAMKGNPSIISRIIYCSSAHNEEYMQFIKNNNMRLVVKPFNISDIRKIVREVLVQTK